MDDTEATRRALDAAEHLFYRHGLRAVGMDRIRAASGVSLKRLYQCFPSKDDLIEAYLRRRDERWTQSLHAHVDASGTDPQARLDAVFDWLEGWFAEPDFRGCAFLNATGEMGDVHPGVARTTRRHKQRLRDYLVSLVRGTGHPAPEPVGAQLLLLVEGAIVTAAVEDSVEPARQAAEAARALLAATSGAHNAKSADTADNADTAKDDAASAAATH
ncbi:TetR/AcrR family transcriptional regulator [Allostreptomyces psammosilenae]|uniref:AcrR family transcriptional regulator n=1 Tax=Allostreptomyces psammosilenae TaxID=1892865 RepID=A0A852ZZT7_9ACTN|nr:TetR/AcrR family transcriptional regulator [Allostreptomyces psammosilenae]NYI07883.1 AcrR family transcriptional regulator [Allostreptomyces psammosilenae]